MIADITENGTDKITELSKKEPFVKDLTKEQQDALLDKLEELTVAKKRRHDKEFTTEKGVVIRYNKVSSDAVRKAYTAVPIPKPPEVWIKDRGRYEPNPADPGYIAEMAAYSHKTQLIASTIYLMHGTDIVAVPEGVPNFDSDEWFEGFEQYWDIPKGALARKTQWLQMFILDDDEKNRVVTDIMVMSGFLIEEDVTAVINSFRPPSVQETNNEVQGTK